MMSRSKIEKYPGRRGDQQGAILALLAFVMVPLVMLLALAFDGYFWLASDLEQHNNAEYSALSALKLALSTNTNAVVESRIPSAIDRAEEIAGGNHYLANREANQVLAHELRDKKGGEVTFGYWDRSRRVFINGGTCLADGRMNANAVQVRLKTQAANLQRESSQFKAVFSVLMGYRNIDSQAQVIAYWDELRSLYSFAPTEAQTTERNRLDVNGDTFISPLDVLIIRNYINLSGSGQAVEKLCLDVNSDGVIDQLDLSSLLDYLNRRAT